MPKIQTTPIYSKVDEAIKDGFNVVSAQGSSRSSKTYNILIWLINYCLKHPFTRLSIVRATLPAIKGSVFVDFKEILYNMGIFDSGCLNKTEMIYTLPNGSWIEFFSTDSEQKLRGRKRDILYVNEANELLFIEWQQLKMRTTKFAIVDYNPSFSDDHWLCDLNKEEKTFHFISTYKDNPFLEKTIIDEIESLQHKNKSLWQIYGLGLQAQIEGLIFKDIEIVDEVPQWVKKRWIGLDFGYTNDPSTGIDVSLLDNTLYLDELFYRTQMLSADIVKELKPYSGLKVISESADPRLIQEVKNAGINIYPVEKFKGSIMAGINKMLELNIKVTKRSVNLIKEFKNYTYLQDKDERWLNEPIDAYNHGIDASRYVVLSEILGRNRKSFDLSGVFH
ncbi:PBSX family phage terminase large subunit [Dysgonomonas sp. 521]|uniref:PBSX family phage terminase large subunit n=1 Tax=Dysgonomonas sp. 521 TaxID=2302932 RepID=UPI0013D4E6E0|nr:PBSX family phage terminase large subunit [Dysgonomonas sp. 521]NDV93473.1 PBSX family phage terminase large subunit [Dysgonomonas sp. 521]